MRDIAAAQASQSTSIRSSCKMLGGVHLHRSVR
jgi:hypothetical protein